MKTLNFEKNLTTLDLDTLKRTARYELARGGLRKNAPIEHFNLINDIQERLSNHDLLSTLDPIYVTEKQALRVMYNGDKDKCPIENYLLQRVFTKAHITTNDNNLNPGIAINYNELGIQLGFMTNVHSCTNTLIFGKNLMSTYGHDRVEYNAMIEAFENWLTHFEDKWVNNKNIISATKEREVTEEELFEFLGRLTYNAERNNIYQKNGASLNITQTLRMIDCFVKEENEEKKQFTAWDILNWGTNSLTPEKRIGELSSILETSNKFSNEIIETFLPATFFDKKTILAN